MQQGKTRCLRRLRKRRGGCARVSWYSVVLKRERTGVYGNAGRSCSSDTSCGCWGCTSQNYGSGPFERSDLGRGPPIVGQVEKGQGRAVQVEAHHHGRNRAQEGGVRQRARSTKVKRLLFFSALHGRSQSAELHNRRYIVIASPVNVL